MTATAAPAFRYLGITDECTTCEQCGKPQLRNTVVIQPLDADGNADGDPTYYGSTCAARALGVRGGGREVLRQARGARYKAHNAAQDARNMLAQYGLPETGEPTQDQMRYAVRLYVRSNHNVAERVKETGRNVPDMVRDMLDRYRAVLATAALLGIDVDAPLTY